MLGGLLALAAAVTFAANNAMMRRGVLTGTVAQAMGLTVPLGLAAFIVINAVAGNFPVFAGLDAAAYAWLMAGGVLQFVVGRYCNFRATKAMGANLTGPVQQTSLLFSLGFAFTFLGEEITPLRLAGIVLVFLAPAMMFRSSSRRDREAVTAGTNTMTPGAIEEPAVSRFQPDYREGYLFAVLSAAGYGVAPVFVRAGMPEGAGLGAGLAAGLIAYAAATVVIGGILMLPGRMRHMRSIDRHALTWFGLTGVMVSLSQMCLYMALAIAPVSVVTPIQRTSIVMRVGFARLLNPDQEVFGGRMMLATVVSLLGALALSVSMDTAHSLLHTVCGAIGLAACS